MTKVKWQSTPCDTCNPLAVWGDGETFVIAHSAADAREVLISELHLAPEHTHEHWYKRCRKDKRLTAEHDGSLVTKTCEEWVQCRGRGPLVRA